MKYILCLLATISFMICGCGGSGSSSSLTEGSTNESPSSNMSNLFEVSPLRDLGLDSGDFVCFRIKAYNNYTESDFSSAVCNTIKNSVSLVISWNDVPGNVVGYHLYYGTNKNNATNYFAGIFES